MRLRQRDAVPMSALVRELIQEEVHARKWTLEDFARNLQGSERLAEAYLRGTIAWRPIVAARLSKAFGTSEQYWINLQKATAGKEPH